jgi:hypothetical protein
MVMDRQQLLNQSFQQFNWALSNKSNLKINRKIQCKARKLYKDYGVEQDEILNSLFDDFLCKELHDKYNPENALSTFIVHTTNYGLNIQIRKHRADRKNYPTISLSILAQEGGDSSAISFLETLGAHDLVDYTTPEDLVIAKELLELIYDHFGKDDAEVILGYTHRRSEATRLSIPYDTYCKRLSRKILSFQPILENAGYC